MTLRLAAPAIVFALVGALAWRSLVAKAYSRAAATAVVLLFLAQSAVCFASSGSMSAALLSIGVYAVCASALLLAGEQSVRGIVLIGGALASAQIVVPLGGLFAVAVLPALIGLPRSQSEMRKSLGFLLLLLFMPVVAAIVIAVVPSIAISSAAPVASSNVLCRIGVDVLALLLLPAFGVIGFRTKLEMAALMPAFIGAALLIVFVVAEILGVARDPREAVAAAAAILLAAISEWPESVHRARNALLFSAASAVSGWLVCWMALS